MLHARFYDAHDFKKILSFIPQQVLTLKLNFQDDSLRIAFKNEKDTL